MNPPLRAGHTLLELITTLALLAVLLGLAAPPLARALAWWRVGAARDLVAGELARARALAVARGGAALVLDVRRGRVWIESADTSTVPLDAVEPPVRLRLDGAPAETVRIAYDAVGLGRMANRTLRFRAAGVESGITVSQYGRVRTW